MGNFDNKLEAAPRGLNENSPEGSFVSCTGFPSRLGTSFKI